MSDQQPGDTFRDGVIQQVCWLLEGGHAHATLADAVANFPEAKRGVVPDGLPYSAWQLLEHMRIAQRDMAEFSANAGGTYRAQTWPDDYWPKEPAPPSKSAWDETLRALDADRETFEALLRGSSDADLLKPFAWGSGQSLLQEALQIADHNAYHIAEIVAVRRLLGCWT